ncbi:unnamed protein product [Amoebophrya sp. A25]|nr:unnamed protein product [Amoebophrya sp. A25]|eukprot:GSA25T00007798001.1
MPQQRDGQSYMQVVVPRNCKPGSTFNVKTPDKQWMQVTVPPGARPKQKLVMAYEPLNGKAASGSDSTAAAGKSGATSSNSTTPSQTPKNRGGAQSSQPSTPRPGSARRNSQVKPPSDAFLEEQRKAYEALQDKFMKKEKDSVVVEVPPQAKAGDLVQIRIQGGQLLQFAVPEGLDENQRFVNMAYEFHVKPVAAH